MNEGEHSRTEDLKAKYYTAVKVIRPIPRFSVTPTEVSDINFAEHPLLDLRTARSLKFGKKQHLDGWICSINFGGDWP